MAMETAIRSARKRERELDWSGGGLVVVLNVDAHNQLKAFRGRMAALKCEYYSTHSILATFNIAPHTRYIRLIHAFHEPLNGQNRMRDKHRERESERALIVGSIICALVRNKFLFISAICSNEHWNFSVASSALKWCDCLMNAISCVSRKPYFSRSQLFQHMNAFTLSHRAVWRSIFFSLIRSCSWGSLTHIIIDGSLEQLCCTSIT